MPRKKIRKRIYGQKYVFLFYGMLWPPQELPPSKKNGYFKIDRLATLPNLKNKCALCKYYVSPSRIFVSTYI